MSRLLFGLLALVALGFLPHISTAKETDYSRPGGYLVGTFGAVWGTTSNSFPLEALRSWETDPSSGLALGWRENERLALEVEFNWIPSHQGTDYGSWLLGVNGKFFFLEDRIQPYLVMGANGFWTRPPGALEHEVDWGFRNGLGLDYYLSEDWALNFETSFVWGVGNVWKNYFLETTAGIVYRF